MKCEKLLDFYSQGNKPKSLNPMLVFWISTGCGHDALFKITERGSGIGKCVASVPRI